MRKISAIENGVYYNILKKYEKLVKKQKKANKGGLLGEENISNILNFNELDLLSCNGTLLTLPEHLNLAMDKLLSPYDRNELYLGNNKYERWLFPDSEIGGIRNFGDDEYMNLTPGNDKDPVPRFISGFCGGISLTPIYTFVDYFHSDKTNLLIELGASWNFVNVNEKEPYKIEIREIRENPSKYLAIKFIKFLKKETTKFKLPVEGLCTLEFETNSREYAESHKQHLGFKIEDK